MNIGIVGHVDHGKVTLIAAITRVLSRGGARDVDNATSCTCFIEAQPMGLGVPAEAFELKKPRQNWKPKKYIGG